MLQRWEILHSAKSIELKIYDVSGRLVCSFPITDLCYQNNSMVSVCWDGKDDSGHKVSSGIYFVRLESGNIRLIEKVILIE